jgi:hypothetical protein
MRGFMRLCAAAGVLGCLGATVEAAPETYPLSKVKRGQTGYGMTTFVGSKPEKFTFEVISVMRNYMPKMDLILVKSTDPKLSTSGVWRGMSGSPLFIDDKLMCAFSYAWAFNKQVMGGCTHIDYMKKEGDTIRRKATFVNGPNGTKIVQPGTASMEDWRRLTPKVDAAAALDALGPANKNWLLSAPLPAAIQNPEPYEGQSMTASVPLSVAGFSAPAFSALAGIFADTALTPIRAGGTGGSSVETGPKQFTLGGPISVVLARGDMAMAGTGTVTHIDGTKVLAFGHPMFQAGEWYAPVMTAEVHHVLASQQISHVMATPLVEVGSLVQDRQAMIMADTSIRAPLIPINLSVSTQRGKHVAKDTFRAEILNDKFLTAALAGAIVMNGINHHLPDRDDVTARVTSTVRVKGIQPLTFVDYMYANDGAGSVMGGVRGLRVLVPLLLNPYGPVKIEGIDVNVDLQFSVNFGEVKELRVPGSELVPGKRNFVEVRMTTYNGKDIYERVPVDVPADLAGSIVQLEITSGNAAKLDAAPPVDLPSLVAAFRKLLPGNTWAATIYSAEDGVALDGKLVKDLPASAQDKLRPQSHTQRAQPFKPAARTVTPAARVIDGSHTMLVRVRER